MNTKHKLAHVLDVAKRSSVAGFLSVFALTSAASGAVTTFGSDNDGLGGFTTGASTIVPTPAPAWDLTATAARFTNGPTTDSGQVNSSLLKEYTLNRTAGISYTITGVIDIISTYAADNNRFGISLFANTVDISGVVTGLSLQHNVGNGAFQIVSPGVAGATTRASATYNGLNGASAIGTTFTYRADVAFVGTNIEIDFTLTDQDNFSQVLGATVAAADFTGTHFGFGTRGRVRNPGTNAPFIYDAKSFDVALIPEFSTMVLLSGGIFGWSMLRRRPGSNNAPQKRGLAGNDSALGGNWRRNDLAKSIHSKIS